MKMTNEPSIRTTGYLCIGCPLGCRLEIDDTGDSRDIVEVRGNNCRRGEAFVRQEHIDPRRMVTTTVRIENGLWAKLPVKTTSAVPKDKIFGICEALHALTLKAPVRMGDVIISNVMGTGIDVVATRDMPTARLN
jgi:CxxC motif-containing protein